MPALKKFNVVFHENRTIYAPGDTVSGQVELESRELLKVKEIKIRFVGKAFVHWTEGGQHRVPHTNAKTYFNNSISIPCEGGSLSQGTHSFPFQFVLPDDLPTSYEDETGYIRYYVRATAERPGLARCENTKSLFTALKVHDLNAATRNMMNPPRASNSTTLCGLCCENGLIECDLRLERLGYVAGEWLSIKGRLDNKSRSAISKVSFELLQEITYIGRESVKSKRKTIAKERGPKLRRAQAVNFDGVRMQIPVVPPSENDCPVLKIKYALMLEAHLPWHTANLRTYVPLTVGTVPLRSLPMYSPIKEKADPPLSCAESETPPPKYEPPPPSYEEAVHGGFDGRDDEDDDQTLGIVPYVPRYTFYDWNESAYRNMTFEENDDN